MADQYYDFMTPKFRLSYNNLLKADENDRYQMCMIFEEDESLSKVKELAEKLMNDKFGSKANWPKGFKKPWRQQAEKEDTDGFGETGLFMNASTYKKPSVVDGAVEDIIDPSDIYSGCYCHAKCQLKWFEAKDENGKIINKGIRVLFSHVQKLEDGEPLGYKQQDASEVFQPVKGVSSKKSASSAFDDDDDEDPLA